MEGQIRGPHYVYSKMATTRAGKSAAKKRKCSDAETDRLSSTPANIFKEFKLDRILRDDPKLKMITLVGRFENETKSDAVVLLERFPFDRTSIAETLSSEEGKTKETLKNDIYSTHTVFTPRATAGN